MTDDFRSGLQNRRDSDADLASESDDVAEVFADFVRVDVDGCHELDPRLGEEKSRDLGADGADSILRDRDWLR